MSIGTARFILACLAVLLAAYALVALTGGFRIESASHDALLLTLGLVLGLSKDAFAFYFGSSHAPEPSGEPQPVEVTNPPDSPVPVAAAEDAAKVNQ